MAPAPEPSTLMPMTQLHIPSSTPGLDSGALLKVPPAALPTSRTLLGTHAAPTTTRRVVTSVKQLLLQFGRDSSALVASSSPLAAQTSSQSASAQAPHLQDRRVIERPAAQRVAGHISNSVRSSRLACAHAKPMVKPTKSGAQHAQHSRSSLHTRKRSSSPVPMVAHGRKRLAPKRAAYE